MCNRYFTRAMVGLMLAFVLPAFGGGRSHACAFEASVAKERPYRVEMCSYCADSPAFIGPQQPTWCEIRANGKPQCRACKVERFFERVLYAPLGYSLQKWQRRDLREIYGNVRPEDGLRIYRKGYWSVAKQNGKTWILGGLPIYHLECEDVDQPEAYVVASAKDQAGVAFKASMLLVRSNPVLSARYKINESTRHMARRPNHPKGRGTYDVLSADGDVQDGKRPSLLLFDELHRMTRKKAETVRTVLLKGFKSRDIVQGGVRKGEPLMLQTTTSGDEEECPMWHHEYEYACHVIDRSIADPAYFARIYQADPKRIESDPEYWKTREARVAANPSHEDNGGFLSDAVLEAEMQETVRRPEMHADFIRLTLNVPVVSTGTPIMDMAKWYAGGGALDMRECQEFDVEHCIRIWGLMNRPCYVGIDMAWTTDLACVAFLFPPYGSDDKWKVLPFFWLPKGRLAKLEQVTRAEFAKWAKQKFLLTAEGSEVDDRAIMEKVLWGTGMFDVREVTFDKWGNVGAACDLVLVPEGITCVKVPQTIAGLTGGTKAFLGAYLNDRIEHGNHPILNWNASCLALKTDGGDNCKPVKPARDTASKRIDGVAATITAWTRAMTLDKSESIYETQGARYV